MRKYLYCSNEHKYHDDILVTRSVSIEEKQQWNGSQYELVKSTHTSQDQGKITCGICNKVLVYRFPAAKTKKFRKQS